MRVDTQELMGLSDVAAFMGVSASTVCNWRWRYSDFPEPVCVISGGSIGVWRREDIAKYRRQREQARKAQHARRACRRASRSSKGVRNVSAGA